MSEPHHSETLIRTEGYCIDHFLKGPTPGPVLACTFTDGYNDEIDGLGFAGSALLGMGFDVLAVKTNLYDWYQTVPRAWWQQINAHLARFNYARRVGYGSSLGGHALIQFCGFLNIDQVLAFSPQFQGDPDFDDTWQKWSTGIDFTYRVTPASFPKQGHCLILCDNKWHADGEHTRRIANCLPPERCTVVHVPYAGHPLMPYLKEIGVLKKVVEQGLRQGHVKGIDLRGNRKQSVTYWRELAMAVFERNKPLMSLSITEAALARFPMDEKLHSHRVGLLLVLEEPEQAIEAAKEGLLHCPNHDELREDLARMLESQAKDSPDAAD